MKKTITKTTKYYENDKLVKEEIETMIEEEQNTLPQKFKDILQKDDWLKKNWERYYPPNTLPKQTEFWLKTYYDNICYEK